MKKTLIIQGGGFRTGFSAGVLDAFLSAKHNDFNFYIGVSGGAIALSYYLSEQYRCTYNSMCYLASHKEFLSFNRVISIKGMMDIDMFHEVAETIIPFDVKSAIKKTNGKEIAMVMTDRETGEPHYYHPNKKTWMDAVIASCTMPFVTKGKHTLHNVEYMDGGWSDPLPVKWAYEHGSKEIVFIRTSPKDMKFSQSWTDYFGGFMFRSNPEFRKCFDANHLKYNEAIDFMNNCPDDLNLIQIAPNSPLKAGTYSNSVPTITQDYRHGLDKGLEYLQKLGLNK